MNSYRDAMLSDDDERMRRFLVDTLAPSDPVKASDAELEVLREQLPHEPFSEERDESLLKKIETLMREASQSAPPLHLKPHCRLAMILIFLPRRQRPPSSASSATSRTWAAASRPRSGRCWSWFRAWC